MGGNGNVLDRGFDLDLDWKILLPADLRRDAISEMALTPLDVLRLTRFSLDGVWTCICCTGEEV